MSWLSSEGSGDMKRKSIFALALALWALTACGKTKSAPASPETVVEELPVVEGGDYASARGLRYEGDCTAPKSNGAYEGEGSFASTEGWRYTGSFSGGVFGSGTVEALPYTLRFGGVNIPGTYSGAVKELLPEGQGSFTAADGGSYTGGFSGGIADAGQAEGLGASLFIGNSAAKGRYTGSVAGGAMDGQGVFTCEKGRVLRYEGGFQKGEPAGNGTLSDSGFLCLNGNDKDRGVFEGTTLNGLPEGQGSFRGRNSDNIDYSYTGSWAAGLFDGEGRLLYESELYYDRVGHFTAGKFTPTGMELLECLGTAGPRFTLSEKTRAYIEKHPEYLLRETLLKKTDEFDYKGEYNAYLTFPNYMSDPAKFEGAFMYVFNDKILYRRTITAFGDDYPVGMYVGANALYADPVICYFLGSCNSFDSANVFNCYAIPLGKTSYTNANGDAVDAIALLVAAINTF